VEARRIRRWITHSRTLEDNLARDEGQLFGIRALEAGFNGGIVQSRHIPRQSSLMRHNRLSRTRSSYTSRSMPRPLALSPVTRPPRYHQSPILSIDLGDLQNLREINACDGQEDVIPEGQHRQSIYSTANERTRLLSNSYSQPGEPRNFQNHADDLIQSRRHQSSLSRLSKSFRSAPRLPTLQFDHRHRRLSLPAALRIHYTTHLTRNSWQELEDQTNDLDGAVEYKNRYSRIASPPSRTTSLSGATSRHRDGRLSPTVASLQYPTAFRASAFSSDRSDGILSFYGYNTAEQSTWDGMSFRDLGPATRMLSPPPIPPPSAPSPDSSPSPRRGIALRLLSRSPQVSPTPFRAAQTRVGVL